MSNQIATILCALALMIGATQAQSERLETLPELPLEEVAEPVREALTEARDRLEQARTRDTSDAALAEAWGRLADVCFAHELITHARIAYRNAIALRGDRQEWHYLLGLLEISEGNFETAIDSLTRALEIYPQDHAALIHRARAYLELGDLERAESNFLSARQIQPESAAALAGLGRVALQAEDHEQAVEYLAQALERSPRASRLHYLLGTAYRALGQTERAREHLAQGGETAVPVRDPVFDRVRSMSKSPQFFHEMGLAQADAGQLEAAERMLARARELDPGQPDILRDHGEVLARLGRLDEAREVFSRWMEGEPESARPHFYLGQLAELQGEPDAALAAYEAALARDPDDLQTREAIAHVLLNDGDANTAIERFDELSQQVESTEEASRLIYWRGLAQLAAGQCAAAADSFEQAHGLVDRYNASVLTALARVRATCARGSDDELNEALEWAELIYNEQPGLQSAATLAMVQAARGEFRDAVDYQAQAIFEALKAESLESHPALQANMQRYQAEQPAEVPFGPDDPVFSGGLLEPNG